MPVAGLWATPVYFGNAGNKFDAIQKEIKTFYDRATATSMFSRPIHFGKTSHSITDFNYNMLVENDMENTRNFFLDCVREYIYGINGTAFKIPWEFKFSSSWLTETLKGEHAVPHTHAIHGDDISGAYYYKTNGKDGALTLINPSPILDATKFINSPWSSLQVPPEEGRIVLFPSWLAHFVEENQTDNNRISLSFNIKLMEK